MLQDVENQQMQRQELPQPVAQRPEKPDKNADEEISRKAEVRRAIGRCKRAKGRWEKDFKRMKENEAFVAMIQWDGQKSMRDEGDRYICNLTLGAIKNKEASLYARNPQVEATPRPREYFELWDGTVEMLMEASQGMQQSAMTGVPNLEAIAIMRDFVAGRQEERLVKKICKTLRLLCQHFMDESTPDFKAQMKKLVCRVLTCGVGYIMPSITVEGRMPTPNTVETMSLTQRMQKAKAILEKVADDKITEDSPELETLRSLVLSLQVSQQTNDYELSQRLEFDFPPATSIFPDENCRDLNDFVGAKIVVHEMQMLVEEINTMFELTGDKAVKAEKVVTYDSEQPQIRQVGPDEKADDKSKCKVCLWRIFDSETRCDYYVVEGHEDYIREPQPLEPCVKGFYPIVAIMFNNIEYEPDTKGSVYPPADVDLMRDSQKEWNRTRDALRSQRNANAPKYLCRKGLLTDADKLALKNAEPNEVIELEGVPPEMTPDQVVVVMQVKEIDAAVYDTGPLEQDLQLAARVQQANIGPAQPDVTATVGTISEQNRAKDISSNVDDLDMGLSKLVSMMGQMILQTFSKETADKIVGKSTWPELNRGDYLNSILVDIKAASSGRPNQALKVATRERITPLLLQAGANPIAVIEELVSTMDDQLDVQKFFPLPGQQMLQAGPNPAGPANPAARQGPRAPQQPLQRMSPEAGPVPLAAG